MNGSPEHYFTAQPASAADLREISVTLAGRRVNLVTAGGVFSPEHLDQGTEILLTHTPPVAAGPVLDLGCGWGPIALTAAIDAPEADVWAVDVNERALGLTRNNADRIGASRIRAVTPDEVPEDLQFAQIRSNPPIRVGKAVLHDMLQTWLPRLAPGGVAYFVVAKHLGAESLTRWIAESFPELTVDRYARAKGFHIIRARRA